MSRLHIRMWLAWCYLWQCQRRGYPAEPDTYLKRMTWRQLKRYPVLWERES